jgi:uncharacterized protein (DUF488 family)
MTKKPPQDTDWPAGAIFTVGHSTRAIEEFIALLQTYGIERLADVRTVPRSRHNPQFNADELGRALQQQNIDYVPLQALGGLRHARNDSINTGWRNTSFRVYADYMQTESFQQGLEKLIALSREKRTAIMCAEAVPWRCHRSLVADALSVRDIPVIEILSEIDYRPHKLTAFAHVEGITLECAFLTLRSRSSVMVSPPRLTPPRIACLAPSRSSRPRFRRCGRATASAEA